MTRPGGRTQLLVGCVLGILLVAATTDRADAAQERALVFPLTGSVPGQKDTVLTQMTHVVARSAGLTGAEVQIGKVTFEDTATLAGCSSPDAACLSQVAAALHVDDVVLGTVTPSDDKQTLHISLIAFVDGKVTERSFDIPVTDVDTMLKKLAQEAPAVFVGAGAKPKDEAPPPPPPPPKDEPEKQPPPPPPSGFQAGRVGALSWVLTGIGAVAAGGGGVLLYMAQQKQADVDAAPVATVDDFHRLQELEDQGEQYTTIGNIALIGGGAALVVGVGLVLYQGYSHSGEERAQQVSFAPLLAPGTAGLQVQVSLP